ncbi:putative P2Y purinoceptor 10 [Protopterus annectens]|uniref:putative P2Y purinoceptor 10 n=1 Tax=Protopterus annectens TaxID=7888 RepID=UPI001CFA5119|nr:putative P2Y purinoceptor 10 [Protopterus annectens]
MADIFTMQCKNSTFNCSIEPELYNFIFACGYATIFIPGLLTNSAALWILYNLIRKKRKALIFMFNLSIADFLHVLTFPLQILYYLYSNWPFQPAFCLTCLYFKYLNMYTSVVFLICISIQRCIFLVNPFQAKHWKQKYDIFISILVWLSVGAGCVSFVISRELYPVNHRPCFTDIRMKNVALEYLIAILTGSEMTGFILPLVIITICTWKTMQSLRKNQTFSQDKEKIKRALRTILMCTAVFLMCFAPYHINLPFYSVAVHLQHCSSLCVLSFCNGIFVLLASLNCCMNPFIYYLTADEFRKHLFRRSQRLQSSLCAI